MITVFVNSSSQDAIKTLKGQTIPVSVQLIDFAAPTALSDILKSINELSGDSWVSFVSGNQLAYRNKYEILEQRAGTKKNIASVFSDFEVFNTKTHRLEKIFVDPYNIRTWGEKFIIPLDGIFLVAAIKESKVLPDTPKFWQNILNKYTFLHCPQFLTTVRA